MLKHLTFPNIEMQKKNSQFEKKYFHFFQIIVYSCAGKSGPRGKVIFGCVFGFRDKYLKKLKSEIHKLLFLGKFTLKPL